MTREPEPQALRDLKRAAAKLARAHEQTNRLEEERNQLILASVQAGLTTRQIAAAIGVTQARVVQITVALRDHLDGSGGD